MRSKPNAYRNGNCDANTDSNAYSNASAEAYADAQAASHTAASPVRSRLTRSLFGGSRSNSRVPVLRNAVARTSHVVLWSVWPRMTRVGRIDSAANRPSRKWEVRRRRTRRPACWKRALPVGVSDPGRNRSLIACPFGPGSTTPATTASRSRRRSGTNPGSGLGAWRGCRPRRSGCGGCRCSCGRRCSRSGRRRSRAAHWRYTNEIDVLFVLSPARVEVECG